MKTESLLLLASNFGILSAWSLILMLDFVIDEEKKKKGRFFNIIIKVGLFKEKSGPVIFLICWMILAIVGLIWSVVTFSNIYKINIIIFWIITILIMAIVLFIVRKFKKS